MKYRTQPAVENRAPASLSGGYGAGLETSSSVQAWRSSGGGRSVWREHLGDRNFAERRLRPAVVHGATSSETSPMRRSGIVPTHLLKPDFGGERWREALRFPISHTRQPLIHLPPGKPTFFDNSSPPPSVQSRAHPVRSVACFSCLGADSGEALRPRSQSHFHEPLRFGGFGWLRLTGVSAVEVWNPSFTRHGATGADTLSSVHAAEHLDGGPW